MNREVLHQQMARLGLEEKDLVETFARSSGPGGQNVNKVSTAVTLSYRRWSVTVQDSRSQMVNRQLARKRLLELIGKERVAKKLKAKAAAAKARRQNPKRSKATKARMLEGKRRRGAIKKMRTYSGES